MRSTRNSHQPSRLLSPLPPEEISHIRTDICTSSGTYARAAPLSFSRLRLHNVWMMNAGGRMINRGRWAQQRICTGNHLLCRNFSTFFCRNYRNYFLKILMKLLIYSTSKKIDKRQFEMNFENAGRRECADSRTIAIFCKIYRIFFYNNS